MLYSDRWWMLVTVLLLNFANYSHWVAFAAVTKNSAKYYDQTGDKIDLITIVSYALGIPCCILAAYAVETFGLNISLKFGGIMTGIGIFCFNILILVSYTSLVKVTLNTTYAAYIYICS